jgi:general secretion pathway protein K
MRALRTIFARARRAPDGFIVVAVLWILGALATLATVYAVYVVNTAIGLGVHDERVRAESLVTAGVELAVYKMTATPQSPPAQGATPESPPTQGAFTFRAERANVVVEFRSESARIDLNAAPKELLAGLFRVLGVGGDLAVAYADRVIAWRTPPTAASQDNESSAYRTAGLPYGPRLGPFPHTAELSLVLGLPELLVERALPFVTVYSKQAQINPFDAAPEVVAALPGMTPDRLHDILAQRDLTPQNRRNAQDAQNMQNLQAALGPAAAVVTLTPSKAARVGVRVDFENGRQMRSEVVVLLLDNGTEPYGVLSWRDLDDGSQDAPPRSVLR